MLMYIACLCPNLVSVHFYAIPILHFKFHKFLFTCTFTICMSMYMDIHENYMLSLSSFGCYALSKQDHMKWGHLNKLDTFYCPNVKLCNLYPIKSGYFTSQDASTKAINFLMSYNLHTSFIDSEVTKLIPHPMIVGQLTHTYNVLHYSMIHLSCPRATYQRIQSLPIHSIPQSQTCLYGVLWGHR